MVTTSAGLASTSTQMTTADDTYLVGVAQEIAENAVFSAFHNLVSYRKQKGMSKSDIAARMHVDRATVTKLTSGPSNMKIGTMSNLAHALDADITFVLIDRKSSLVFTSFGVLTAPSIYAQTITEVGVPLSVKTDPVYSQVRIMWTAT